MGYPKLLMLFQLTLRAANFFANNNDNFDILVVLFRYKSAVGGNTHLDGRHLNCYYL